MFFFKRENAKEEYSIEIMQKIKTSLIILESTYKSSSKTSVQKLIKSIIKSTNKILQVVITNSDKIYELGLFSEYLLPEVAKIAKFYVDNNHNEQAADILAKAKQCILNAEETFSKIANNVTLGNTSIFEADIQLLSEQLQKTETNLE